MKCKRLIVKLKYESYVYWTVHHLDSWVKRDQLDVTCFIISLYNAQHVSDVNTSILGSLRHMYWVISWVVLLWFDVCWCYVVVWLWWCGIRRQAEALVLSYFVGYIDLVRCVLVLRCGLAVVVWYPYASWGTSTTTAKPQRNTNTHRKDQYNPWNNSAHKSQAPEDGCINIRNMLSIIQRNNKTSDIKLVSLYSTKIWIFTNVLKFEKLLMLSF